jgi:hypothetical protein
MTPVLDGLDNLRDLGGLPLRTGGSTRHGVLLRSEAPTFASPADIARLVDELGLRLVIDLRGPAEIAASARPLAVAGVETVDLRLMGQDREHLITELGPAEGWRQVYLGYLVDQPDNIVTAVRRIAEPGAGPVLVHCMSGKDRTGVLVAVVLAAVGVDRAAIVADFVTTADNYPALLRRRHAAAGTVVPADLSARLPVAFAIEGLLDHLDEHGGAAGWLLSHGLADAELAVLRERLGAS